MAAPKRTFIGNTDKIEPDTCRNPKRMTYRQQFEPPKPGIQAPLGKAHEKAATPSARGTHTVDLVEYQRHPDTVLSAQGIQTKVAKISKAADD